MALTINRASAVETTLGITFAIGQLPTVNVGNDIIVSTRTPNSYTITTSASAIAGAQSISVSATPVLLDSGTLLNFGGITATLSNAAPAGSTTLQTLPLPGGIGSGATATTNALLFVAGCTEAVVSPQIKNSDTTNYLSGLGMEKRTVGNAKTMTLNFNLVFGDRGGNLLRSIAYDPNYAGLEFWFNLLFPSGESHQGAALLETANPTNPVQEKRTFSCTAQVQGASYIYTPPTPYNIF